MAVESSGGPLLAGCWTAASAAEDEDDGDGDGDDGVVAFRSPAPSVIAMSESTKNGIHPGVDSSNIVSNYIYAIQLLICVFFLFC